jgi:uncharacterized protein YggU (UPF0235/DUF167 family)
VTPRGGRNAIDGWMRDGAGRPMLKARVTAAPADGAANEALITLLAQALGRPRSALRLALGAKSRVKQMEAEGVSEADLASAFGPPPAGE